MCIFFIFGLKLWFNLAHKSHFDLNIHVVLDKTATNRMYEIWDAMYNFIIVCRKYNWKYMATVKYVTVSNWILIGLAYTLSKITFPLWLPNNVPYFTQNEEVEQKQEDEEEEEEKVREGEQ